MFSKACEYAIRATIYIGEQSLHQHRVGLKEISAAVDSPEAFTAKILQQLVRSGIVESVKGPNGGFEMTERSMEKVRLSHVVAAIDGESVYKGCGLGVRYTNSLRR
jgi:Rrf2 family protein